MGTKRLGKGRAKVNGNQTDVCHKETQGSTPISLGAPWLLRTALIKAHFAITFSRNFVVILVEDDVQLTSKYYNYKSIPWMLINIMITQNVNLRTLVYFVLFEIVRYFWNTTIYRQEHLWSQVSEPTPVRGQSVLQII